MSIIDDNLLRMRAQAFTASFEPVVSAISRGREAVDKALQSGSPSTDSSTAIRCLREYQLNLYKRHHTRKR